MEFENQESIDADNIDQYYKLAAISTGREIANFVASNIFIHTIEFSLTLEDAEREMEAAIASKEEFIAPHLQDSEISAQSFRRERKLFVDNYVEVLNLRMSAIAERLDDGG